MGRKKVLARKAPLTLTFTDVSPAEKRRPPASSSIQRSKCVASCARGKCRCSGSPWFISIRGTAPGRGTLREAPTGGTNGRGACVSSGPRTAVPAFTVVTPFLCTTIGSLRGRQNM